MKDGTDRTPTTSEGLLREAASSPDSPRREEFAVLYSSIVRRYVDMASGPDVPREDRDDIAQEVLASVLKALPGFRHDRARGRFRGYLRASVSRAIAGLVKRRRAEQAGFADAVDPESLAAAEKDSESEMLWQVWTAALARVFRSGRLAPNTIAMFRRFAVEGKPAADVAAEFKTNANAVYQCKNRVMSAVRAEIRAFGHGRVSLEEVFDSLVAAEPEEP